MYEEGDMENMRSDILDIAVKLGVFLSPDALEYILSDPDPVSFTNTTLSALSSDKMFVGRSDLEDCLYGDAPIITSPGKDVPKNKRHTDIKIIDGTDVTGNSLCEGEITDFTSYFKSRYDILSRIIARRKDFGVGMPIDRAMQLDRDVRIIGLVYEVTITKNGHIILNVEDNESGCKVFISKDSPLVGESFVNDEVIGIMGRPNGRKELLIAEEIFRPDIPRMNRWKPSDSVSSVAFLSDVHVGSNSFLEDNWKRMTKWLRNTAYDTDLDYIVLPGDVVDGIGIFPGQETELSITDIYEQYEALAEYLKEVPDHIKMVLQPGNHDAVRLAEPQPALGDLFTKTFDSNIILAGNPASLEIEGRRILSYHGKGIDDWISNVQKLTYDDPMSIMEEMLKRRHLAPIYGQRTALAPERKDYMAIDEVPDIFVSGHIHGAGASDYRGVKTINASAWQSQTEFQKMHNFNPEPAIMPIVHLGTGEINMKNFMD
ncbi:MAG TPA: DNA-directed DNA polymerase II small subunit [Candidatus Methanomethylophilaceae archaeon]|nr:DNA-directed DNA polymerase II small subunit [Candidatus Methanomethylophilaceae archaeon]